MRALGAVTGERERQTWDCLLLTPLDTRALLHAKVWGIAHSLTPYVVAFGIASILVAAPGGIEPLLLCVYFAVVNWLVSYFCCVLGVWCSALGSGSWRALLSTVAMGCVYFMLGCAATGMACGVSLLVAAVPMWLAGLAERQHQELFLTCFVISFAATSVVESWLFILLAQSNLDIAAENVDRNERSARRRRRKRGRQPVSQDHAEILEG